MNDLRSDHQVYSSFASNLPAIISANLFSKPSARWFENGMLFGSAQTRRTRCSAATHGRTAIKTRLRQRKDIQHSALCGVLAQVRHRVSKAQRRSTIYGVNTARDDSSGPAAHA